MKTVHLQQGSPEWLAHRRTTRNASDAPAMMGSSPYVTRAELVRQYATGVQREIDERTQAIFDRGHEVEPALRALAEKIIGEDLYPVTGVSDDGYLGASFDGVNLWNTTTATNVTTNTSGGTYQVGFGTTDIAAATGITGVTTTATAATATTTAVDAAIKEVTTRLATLGTQSKSIGRQLTFVNKLQDATEAGIGNLVDADLAKESARLTALQTKQQLGVQALSIANSSSSILLGLFR